jgi:hypothetical protein
MEFSDSTEKFPSDTSEIDLGTFRIVATTIPNQARPLDVKVNHSHYRRLRIGT